MWFNGEVAAILELPSGKIDKYEFLQVKKYYLLIKKVKEQARFTYSPLEKVVDWSEL